MKKYFQLSVIILVLISGGIVFFKYFLTFEKKNMFQRSIENITGQNLTVTVFDVNGKVIKRWYHIKKITSPEDGKSYTFFYTSENKYVQIPNSVWYIAEEE